MDTSRDPAGDDASVRHDADAALVHRDAAASPAAGSQGSAGRVGQAGATAAAGVSADAGPRDAAVAARACATTEPWPSGTKTCLKTSDCQPGDTCYPLPPPPQNCGSPCPGCFRDLCKSDAECNGGVCVNSGPFNTTMCVARCDSTGCASGQRCEANGRCSIHPCDQGFDCGRGRRCSPNPGNAAANGCEVVACYEVGGVECPGELSCARDSPPIDASLPGCALLPCDDPRHPGCPVNQRCTGVGRCTALACKSDADCDCGVCIDPASNGMGGCGARPGVCRTAYTACPP